MTFELIHQVTNSPTHQFLTRAPRCAQRLRSLSRVSVEGAHSDRLCQPLRDLSPDSSVGPGSTRLTRPIASATASGITALAIVNALAANAVCCLEVIAIARAAIRHPSTAISDQPLAISSPFAS